MAINHTTTIGAPSRLRLIRKAAALARARPTLLLSCARKLAREPGRCLLRIDEAKANIKPIYECRCNGRLQTKGRPNDKAGLRSRGVVYLQQIKKKAKAEGKTCHAKTMLSLEKPIKLL